MKMVIGRLKKGDGGRNDWGELSRKDLDEGGVLPGAEENIRILVNRPESAEWKVPRGFSVKSVREDRDSR